jgi:hypothetical protein
MIETHEAGRSDDETARFLESLQAAEDELTAPGLCALPSDELSSVIYTVTALAADPGGNCNDGPYLHVLDQSLGRWSRRKIRKTLAEISVREIQALDCDAWRTEVRLLAAGHALDDTEGDLRSALLALAGLDAPDGAATPTATADISALVAGSSLARRLLEQVVMFWCDEISRTS